MTNPETQSANATKANRKSMLSHEGKYIFSGIGLIFFAPIFTILIAVNLIRRTTGILDTLGFLFYLIGTLGSVIAGVICIGYGCSKMKTLAGKIVGFILLTLSCIIVLIPFVKIFILMPIQGM